MMGSSCLSWERKGCKERTKKRERARDKSNQPGLLSCVIFHAHINHVIQKGTAVRGRRRERGVHE